MQLKRLHNNQIQLPEFNISSEKGLLGDDFSFGKISFSVAMLGFRWLTCFNKKKPSPRVSAIVSAVPPSPIASLYTIKKTPETFNARSMDYTPED